ncbi:MAG: PQQ-binding-like beta-propeller repeat protein [Candidatus Eisenbacteria bacterium]
MQSIATVPDIDGDGLPDVAFEGYGNGPSNVDHVFAIRGASVGQGEVLWSSRPLGGASNGGGDGDDCLRLGPDLDGDGFPELLLGTAWGGRTAYALHGNTGEVLWGFDTYAEYGDSYSGWIYSMDSLGQDLDEDGIPEIVFASGSSNDRVHCVSGASGGLVWVYYGGDAFRDVHSCVDIDGDQVRDVIVSLGDQTPISPRVVALSGVDGHRIWETPVGGAIWNIVFLSDLTGDGIPEITLSQWSNSLVCLNGDTGAVVWSVPVPAQQRVAALDDVDGDGKRDVAVGCNTTSICQVRSGADGELVWNVATSDWTWAIDRMPDVSGDGINDVVVGDFDGWVRLLDGASGAEIWSWLNPTGDKIKTIRGTADLNGNGAPDVVAGTQLLYGGSGGDVYALEGNPNAMGVAEGLPSTGARLGPGFPNPSFAGVRWSIAPGVAPGAELSIFAVDGRRVRTLAARAGTIAWDGRDERGRDVPAGVYRARLAGGEGAFEESKPIVLIR